MAEQIALDGYDITPQDLVRYANAHGARAYVNADTGMIEWFADVVHVDTRVWHVELVAVAPTFQAVRRALGY